MKTKLAITLLVGIVIGVILGKVFLAPAQTQETEQLQEDSNNSIETENDLIALSKEQKIKELEERNYLLSKKNQEIENLLDNLQKEEMEKSEALREAKEKLIAKRIKEYEALFDLSTDQAYLIGEWEWELSKFWKDFHAGKKTAKDPVPLVEDKMRRILSPEQLEIYESHLEKKHNSAVELTAQAQLTSYPTNINLSEGQKDKIYENLYYMHHDSTSAGYADELNQIRNSGRFNPGAEYQLIAARGVLSDEQLEELERQLSRSGP